MLSTAASRDRSYWPGVLGGLSMLQEHFVKYLVKLGRPGYIKVAHNGILAHNHGCALTTELSEHRSLSNNYFDEGEQDEHWNASTSDAEW
jgi:hypothetical protein